MTTLTSADGAPEVINARRTESLDAPNILKLVQSSTEALFGRVNVVNLIEKAVLAVTLSNDREEVLGHAAFFDYPNLSSVDTAMWEKWFQVNYKSQKCTPLNTLFLSYFVAKNEYSHGCAKEIIRTMFNAVPDVHYCFLVVPTGVFPDASLADLFQPLQKTGSSSEDCAVFVCYRHQHVPVLHIRHAKVEDTDDLIPIFNRQSDMLSQTYGDYFLAELIEAQDDSMKCIVAEVAGTAVGFMSISSDVNVDMLNECFELGAFHGLREPDDDDETKAPETPVPTPPPESAKERQARSGGSAGSRSSTQSQSSAKKNGSATRSASDQGSKQASPRLSRPSSKAGSIKGEEAKVKTRLSDGDLAADGATLCDNSDAESVASCASQRAIITDDPEKSAATIILAREPSLNVPSAKRFVPSYKGPSSAFCIQLFCIDEKYETRSMDFLAKAFDLFPGKKFIVMTVPHLVPEFLLLQQFVRITPRCPSTLAQELYVFSRAGLLRDLQVRVAGKSDFNGVSILVDMLDLKENLLEDLEQFNKAHRDDDGTTIKAFVAESCGQVVGVAVVRAEEDIEYIRSHYNIEDFIYFNHHSRNEHGHLHHFAINPIFKHYAKHFLKEVLRQGRLSCLYYPVYPPYSDKEKLKSHSLVTALQDLVAVRPRRQIIYPDKTLGINAPSDLVLKKKDPSALYHINRKLTLEPKVTINARIVVVGASDTALAFLETLVFCPHLKFNNVTLISPHGLPGQLAPDTLRDQMLASSQCYTEEEYALLSLRTWVNSVYGKMTAINRHKKHVTVNYETQVPYDHLILCPGTQHQVPAPTNADISQGATNENLPNSPDRFSLDEQPKNVLTVNDTYDAAVALYWVENNILSAEGEIVVYGDSVDAYSCIQTLLTLGLPGNRLHLVFFPVPPSQATCVNHPGIEAAVDAALKQAGVSVHRGYILASWSVNDENVVTSVSFTSDDQPLTINCNAFFSYYKKNVDYQAFKAVNDACLVYDGRLVIDAGFHTNDVAIRAAGPFTKFQRCYHADDWTHNKFNSKEVGIQLATSLLRLFDPTMEPEAEPAQDMLKLIPMYRSPKIITAVLPGGYHYLKVNKPGTGKPLEEMRADNDYGRELETGSPGGEQDYFSIHLNQYNTVETLTCLATKVLPVSNLICLFGVHQRLLNNLLSRFDEGLIPDLYNYFEDRWALAIYHDRFADFKDEVRELLITRPADDVDALEEKIRQMIDEDLTLNKDQRQSLIKEFAESGAKRAVEMRLLSFLSYNNYHLPMYARPGML